MARESTLLGLSRDRRLERGLEGVQAKVFVAQTIAWGGEEGDGNNNVHRHQHYTLKIVRFAVLDCVNHNKNSKDKGDGFDCRCSRLAWLWATTLGAPHIRTCLEAHRQVMTHNPSKDDQERRDEHSNLDTGSNRNLHGLKQH